MLPALNSNREYNHYGFKILIIIMVIFKCYFSGELIALSYIKKKKKKKTTSATTV